MPIFVLKVKAELENIARIHFNEDNIWKFDVESESGEVREGITFTKSEEFELSGSRGTANFVMKWDSKSPHQAYIKIVDIKKMTGEYTANDSGSMVAVLGMECRGLVPSRWIPGADCYCESVGGKKFDEVDLTEGDWAEYDDENDAPVSITGLEHAIDRA